MYLFHSLYPMHRGASIKKYLTNKAIIIYNENFEKLFAKLISQENLTIQNNLQDEVQDYFDEIP